MLVTLADVVARGGDLGTVEDRSFLIREFRLQNGTVMPELRIAYETYGRLAPDGRKSDALAGALTWASAVGVPGFEPGTSASRTLRANQAALHPV